MNWEAISAIGEMIGAFAVIATLVYLSVQLKQNTKGINSNNHNFVTQGFNQFNLAIFSDPDLAKLSRKGIFDIDKLSDVDKVRSQHMFHLLFNIYRNLYHQYLDGSYPESQWLPWAYEAKQMIETEGGKHFRSHTSTYDDLLEYLAGLTNATRPLSIDNQLNE